MTHFNDTPPAVPEGTSDVREAARKRLDEREEYAEQHGYPTFQDEPSAYLNGFEDGAEFEVRPRGPVSDAAVEAAYQALRHNWRITREDARTALEAAREVNG